MEEKVDPEKVSLITPVVTDNNVKIVETISYYNRLNSTVQVLCFLFVILPLIAFLIPVSALPELLSETDYSFMLGFASAASLVGIVHSAALLKTNKQVKKLLQDPPPY